MRLLHLDNNGSLSLRNYWDPGNIPPYAVLSHTWQTNQEVTHWDMVTDNDKARGKAGYGKLCFFTQQAKRDGLNYIWVDTCCIDRSSSSEIQEAIDSKFHWFQNAAKCYVYLRDVSASKQETSSDCSESTWETAFQHSRWFTRALTLPELLAPRTVAFFSREGTMLGDKASLQQPIHQITGIPIHALQGASLSNFTIEERLSWARNRQALRIEDIAYALLGIFNVSMPIMYGEGLQSAFSRLREEIDRSAGIQICRVRTPLVYNPLDGSEIRILVLHPGEESEDLSAHLETGCLYSKLRYQALSYVWGQEPALHSLHVNEGEKFAIRPNLFQALRRIRLQSKPIRLWVDSICINQSNEEERNLQVQRMGDIFRRAKSVWIWLGEEHSHSASVMDLIPQLNRPGFIWKDSWWLQHNFLAFNGLLSRPWFGRGWVAQEAAFSANSIVLCGDRHIHWKDLTASVLLIQKNIEIALSQQISTELTGRLQQLFNKFYESPASRLFNLVSDVFQLQQDGQLVKKLKLERLVEIGTHFETTDPRDAIYALMNLAQDTVLASPRPHRGVIIPDYRKDTSDVFADFILHCCHVSESLDIICRPWAPVESANGYTTYHGQVHTTKAPSWIITRDKLPFGDPSKGYSHRLHSNSLVEQSRIRVYNAHFNKRPQADIRRLSGNNEHRLSLLTKGVVIGTVTHRSMRMANAIITKDCLALLEEVYRGSLLGVQGQTETISRVLCTDLLGRRDKNKDCYTPIVQWLQKMFEALSSTGDTVNTREDSSAIDVEEVLAESPPQEIRTYLELVRQCVWNRRTFRGKSTYNPNSPIAGLIPQYASVGDTLCILYGCSVPVVLRKHEGNGLGYWQLIGEAYVHGWMDGEGVSSLSPEMRSTAEVDFEIL